MPPNVIDGERSLNGPEKAAALLLMLGPPAAARVLKHFEPPELRIVARVAAGLGHVAAPTLDRLVEEFVAEFAAGTSLLGDAGRARSLLADALLPADVDAVLSGASTDGAGEDVWKALERAPESALIGFLSSERPATAAYVLSRIHSAQAAKIVGAMPREQRNAALCGLVSPREVTPFVARLVEDALRGLVITTENETGADGRARIAGIINSLEPEDAADVIRAIGEARPREAAAIKSMLFSFTDLPKLSERARSLLFDRAPMDIVVMALRGTDPEFRSAVLTSLPARGRRLVEGELANSANANPRDVGKARKAIAELVLGMAARNEIELDERLDEAA